VVKTLLFPNTNLTLNKPNLNKSKIQAENKQKISSTDYHEFKISEKSFNILESPGNTGTRFSIYSQRKCRSVTQLWVSWWEKLIIQSLKDQFHNLPMLFIILSPSSDWESQSINTHCTYYFIVGIIWNLISSRWRRSDLLPLQNVQSVYNIIEWVKGAH